MSCENIFGQKVTLVLSAKGGGGGGGSARQVNLQNFQNLTSKTRWLL